MSPGPSSPAGGNAQSFLVEHYRPGITADAFRAAMARVRASAAAMRRDGSPVRCVHSTLVPEDEAVLSVIDAASSELVEQLFARAGVRVDRIVTVLAHRAGFTAGHRRSKMPRTSSFVLILTLTGFAAAAHAAPTSQQLCESAMELASAKYAQCRLTAESKYAKSLDAAKRTAALEKCSTKLGDAFAKATARFGGECAATEPSTAFDAYLQQCTDDTVAAAAGAPLSGACDTDLATCESELAACESPLLARLLQTGQVTSYGTGSDGDLEKGVAPAYLDNGDGTITDTKTGLVWEKKSDDGTIHDKDDTYTLGLTVPLYTVNGTAVTTFLAALNAGGGFAGYTDWRLPNLTELESLRNLENVNPAVATPFDTGCGAGSSGNPGCTVTTCSCTTPDIHWSSSTYAGSPELAWAVSFGDGAVDADFKDIEYFVRAVRGGS